jgi:hypothetical protein
MLAKTFMAKNANLGSKFCKPALLQAWLLRWFHYDKKVYICYLTSMFTCLIRSSMFMFVNLN